MSKKNASGGPQSIQDQHYLNVYPWLGCYRIQTLSPPSSLCWVASGWCSGCLPGSHTINFRRPDAGSSQLAPSADNASFDRYFRVRILVCGFMACVGVFLAHVHHDALMLVVTNNGGEHGPVAGSCHKSSFAHTVDDEQECLIFPFSQWTIEQLSRLQMDWEDL